MSSFIFNCKIDDLVDELDVSLSMLGGLLQVSTRTIEGWARHYHPVGPKYQRVVRLHEFIKLALRKGVEPRLLLNLLHEPMIDDGEDSSSILHFIVHPSDEITQFEIESVVTKFIRDIELEDV